MQNKLLHGGIVYCKTNDQQTTTMYSQINKIDFILLHSSGYMSV